MTFRSRTLLLGPVSFVVFLGGAFGCQTSNDSGPRPAHAASAATEPPPPPPPPPGAPSTPAASGGADETGGAVDRGTPCNATDRCPEGMGCSGLYYDEAGHCIEESKAADRCKKAGGEWGRWGMIGAVYCMRIFEDADEPCTDSSQCKGQCIAHEGGKGRCQRYETQFGCYSVLEQGKVGQGICVD